MRCKYILAPIVFVLLADVVFARPEEDLVVKSLPGRVLRATVWSDGQGWAARLRYPGNALPDSISIEIIVSSGDTTRAVYKPPEDRIFNRAIFEMLQEAPK